RDAKAAGLETFGFFMMGLPNETEETLRKTIDFAVSLPLDMAKVSITVPLPSTPLFNQWDAEGRIKTKDWTKYNLYHPAREIYDHPTCDWDTIERYFKKFYREFYFRPSYVGRRLLSDIRRGTVMADVKMALKTKWW
ncbi:MAG: hypothetical protein K8I02_02760, partial [Candidatus Methylomirabilis sp.]|nr:hypothetical protein [Deltaproteobacteria bacterium]